MAAPLNSAAFTYRTDGLRTEKVTDQRLEWIPDVGSDSGIYDWDTTTNKPTFRYYYDGQMPVEEDYAEITPGNDPFYDVTRYGLGARGVDMIEKETLEDTVVTYPVYDGHGNMVCTLAKSGASYVLSNWRYYDVWGDVNSGSSTGDPPNRYVANLGHQQDDESGLIYMRARYYEPTSGRFVSEDPARDGLNWYRYCENNAVNRIDASGQSSYWESEITKRMASYLKSWSLYFMAVGGLLAFLGTWGVIEGGGGYGAIARGQMLGVAVGGVLLTAAAYFVYTDSYLAATLVVGAALNLYDKFVAPIEFLRGGTLLFGHAGVMAIGLALGCREGDADAWVWGLD